jgi:adenylyltransferase/sulfurtransferase
MPFADRNKRYERQILLPELGKKGQEALGKATVLIAGAGGLGGPASMYLAGAGVGRLIICDNDQVELSNLNRQILYNTKELGKSKASTAGKILEDLNPDIRVETHPLRLDRNNIGKIAGDVDVIADCLDNIQGRMELNHWCIKEGIPMVHAGIEGWNGQITFLHPPYTPCVACLFSEKEEQEGPVPVLGALPGVFGSMQALEVIKYLSGQDGLLKNRMLLFDGLSMQWSEAAIGKLEDCPVCSKI